MKRIISLVLAFVIAFSLPTVASAFENEGNAPDAFADGYAEDAPETPDESETDVFDVTMYLCATANSFCGHVWLYFINNGTAPVDVGYLQLEPGQGMSVGSLSYTRIDGGGTYYNGEARMATKRDALDNVRKHTTSLSMSLSPEQLEKVNGKIRSKNLYSLIFDNCGMFATTIWNSVSDKKVIHIVLPVITVINMMILGGKKGALEMQSVEADNVYKQRDNGVEPATDKNFEKSSVTFF